VKKKFYCEVFDSVEKNMLIYKSYFQKFDNSNHFLVMVGETCATFFAEMDRACSMALGTQETCTIWILDSKYARHMC
jgi:hypothetical protein